MNIYSKTVTHQTAKLREYYATSRSRAGEERVSRWNHCRLGAAFECGDHRERRRTRLLEDLQAWLEQMGPELQDHKHRGKFESNAAIHLQSLLLHHQMVVPFTEGRMDLGPWQFVLSAELDGQRPKRIVTNILGE